MWKMVGLEVPEEKEGRTVEGRRSRVVEKVDGGYGGCERRLTGRIRKIRGRAGGRSALWFPILREGEKGERREQTVGFLLWEVTFHTLERERERERCEL